MEELWDQQLIINFCKQTIKERFNQHFYAAWCVPHIGNSFMHSQSKIVYRSDIDTINHIYFSDINIRKFNNKSLKKSLTSFSVAVFALYMQTIFLNDCYDCVYVYGI